MSKLIDKLGAYGADLAGIEDRFAGDDDLYIMCIGILFEDENLALLGKSIEKKDYNTAFEAAHALKGVTANLGLSPLFHAVSAVVEALRSNTYENLEEQYEEVVAQMERVKDLKD